MSCFFCFALLRNPGEVITSLVGLTTAVPPQFTLSAANSFSVMVSSRSRTTSLLLGPIRFVNHDCHPNAEVSDVMIISLVHRLSFHMVPVLPYSLKLLSSKTNCYSYLQHWDGVWKLISTFRINIHAAAGTKDPHAASNLCSSLFCPSLYRLFDFGDCKVSAQCYSCWWLSFL